MTKKTLEELQQFFTDNGIKHYQYPLKDDFSFNRFIVFEAENYKFCITWYANISTLNLGDEPNANMRFEFNKIAINDFWFKKGLLFTNSSGGELLVSLEPMRKLMEGYENGNK